MSTMKSLAIVALLLGGTSLAIAQAGPPSPGIIPGAPAQSAAPSQSAAPAPRASSGTRIAHRATKPHTRLYMQARHTIPGCTVGLPANATCACGTGASGGPLLCQPGQWCHYPFAKVCTQ